MYDHLNFERQLTHMTKNDTTQVLELLLKKLELYRVGDVALSWFGSYLSERSQFVALDGSLSKRLEVEQGVPQGSVLGPVLFLLFVNDLPLHLHNSSADIFADDTILLLKAHFDDIVNLTNTLSSDLVSFSESSRENRMFINVEKTKPMLVTGKRIANIVNQELELKIDEKPITNVTAQKLVGVTLDSLMSYEPHIDELLKKLSKRLGLLRHISPYLKQRQRDMFYTCVIKPILMYGTIVVTWLNSLFLNYKRGLQGLY